MRIVEFHITRYGPIGYDKPFTLSDFTLFWGKNEHGKTLTIDALVKLLLRKEAKRFDRIDRVADMPSGHVVVTADGKQVKLSEKVTLTDVCKLITEADCRNIFIVRASDLSIGGEEKGRERVKEAEFYTEVTDRLTGLKTKQINDVRKALKNLGKLTPKGDDLRDTQAEPIKGRLLKAERLVERIDELKEVVARERFDDLEEMVTEKCEKRDLLEHEIEGYESARKRELFEKGRAAYDRLIECLKMLKEHESIREEDEGTWRDAERDAANQSSLRSTTAAELSALREKRDAYQKELDEKGRELSILSDRKRRIDEDLRPELKTHELKGGPIARSAGKGRLFTFTMISSAMIAGGGLVGLALRPSSLWLIPVGLFGGLFLYCFVRLVLVSREDSWHVGAVRRIAVNAAKYDLAAPTVEGIYSKLRRFDEDYRRAEETFHRLSARADALEDEISRNTERVLPGIDAKIREAEAAIVHIKEKTRAPSLPELRKALAAKREYEEDRGRQIGILKNFFGDRDIPSSEYLAFWKRSIDELAAFRDARKDLVYDDAALTSLKGQRGEAGKQIEQMEETLSGLKRELSAVERETGGVFGEEAGRIVCETSGDLTAIREHLMGLILRIKDDSQCARQALAIFDQIEAEERGQVSLLFDEEGGVSGYFSSITGGVYDRVSFDPQGGVISVTNHDGQILPADKLSSGAFDQLYLAIRLALGERLVSDGVGFFIMDDPFIRSDPDRLALQMRMLLDVAARGWQIVYFSSKGEVRDVLAKDVKRGAVKLIEL